MERSAVVQTKLHRYIISHWNFLSYEGRPVSIHIISYPIQSIVLISKPQNTLILALSNLSIQPLQPDPHHPSPTGTRQREGCTRSHGNGIAGFVRLGPEVWCPDEGGIGDGVDNGERGGFLLFRLAAGRGDPAENDAVDGVSTDCKYDFAGVSYVSLRMCSSGSSYP